MTCIGMPCDVEERPRATTARFTSASSCGGADGDAYKLPSSMPHAKVTLKWWARWCCLSWLMDMLWKISVNCWSKMFGRRQCSLMSESKLSTSSRKWGWLPSQGQRPSGQLRSPVGAIHLS